MSASGSIGGSSPEQRVGCCGDGYRSGFPCKGEDVHDEPDRFYLDPDNVRKVEFFHQPPGREHVRVTVEYASGEVRVFMVRKGLLASVLARLFAIEAGL